MKKFKYGKILLSLLVLMHLGGAAMLEREISDLTLLLPVNNGDGGNAVTYNITAYNGGYEW